MLLKKIETSGYQVKIDYKKGIYEQELLNDTKTILFIMYKDYICNKDKKSEFNQKDRMQFLKTEEEKREKYNPNNLFNNRKKNYYKKFYI